MNELIDRRVARILGYATMGCFLAMHVGMLVMFSVFGVTPMVYFNVFSIVFYLAMFIVVRKGLVRLFGIAVYLEVIAHMAACILCVGWDTDFQLAIVVMGVLAFFAEYVGRSMHSNHVSGMVLNIVGGITYLVLLFVSHLTTPPYSLPAEVRLVFSAILGVLAFVIMTIILELFTVSVFKHEEVMASWVLHDKLTGLYNRYYMVDHMEKLTSSDEPQRHWLAIVDIDNFKKVNDTYGHNCGDLVLYELANLLRQARKGGMEFDVCRWGGEEFLLVGSYEDDLSSVLDDLERLRKLIERHAFWYKEQRIRVTVTMGVAAYECGTVNEWVNEADERLYEGKQSGKNRVVS